MEVELKLRIQEASLPALRDHLRAMGGHPETGRTQDDVFFQHPARDLAATDEAFRLRREDGRLELTYKGPRAPGDVKAREEHNVGLDGDPMAMLQALGFTPAARLVKTREPWQVDGAEVAIDHVDGLGWFVEIEAKDHDDPHGHVEALRSALGLDGAEAVTASYLEMALEAGGAAATRL